MKIKNKSIGVIGVRGLPPRHGAFDQHIHNLIKYSSEINDEKVFMSVSHTTRTPRSNELDGTDYFFISEEEFKSKINDQVYLEHAIVHGNLYGTPKQPIEHHLHNGFKVLLEIDWRYFS